MRLRRAGIDDFVVLERAGATWRDDVYPGCRCDVPSSVCGRGRWSRAGLERNPGYWR